MSSVTSSVHSSSVYSTAITAEQGIDIQKVIKSKPFEEWNSSIDVEKFKVRSIHIQSVDMFGSKIGFIKFKADVVDESGKFVPGICFMRGGSVGILPLLRCEDKTYTILTLQPRIATGQFDFAEIPAGMLDGSGNFSGVAAKELKEECELEIGEKELTDLSALANHPRGFFASPGGSEETIRLFSFTKNISKEDLQKMNGRCTGELAEGEQITLKVVPLEDLFSIPDGKTIVALALYKKFVEKKDLFRSSL